MFNIALLRLYQSTKISECASWRSLAENYLRIQVYEASLQAHTLSLNTTMTTLQTSSSKSMSTRTLAITISRGRQKTLNTSPLLRVHGASNATGTTVETSALCWQFSWQTDDQLRGHAILVYPTNATSAVNVRLCSEAQQAPSSPSLQQAGTNKLALRPALQNQAITKDVCVLLNHCTSKQVFLHLDLGGRATIPLELGGRLCKQAITQKAHPMLGSCHE
jgi:hypothetical protein